MGSVAGWFFVISGGLLSSIACVIAWLSGSALVRAPAVPPPATVAAAAPGAWVRLDDAVLDCGTRTVSQGTTLFLAAPRGGGPAFLVQREGETGCEGAVQGVFVARTFGRDVLREKLQMNLPDGPELPVFTEALAPPNQKGALYGSLAFLVFGLLLLWTGIRGVRRRG